MKRITLSLLTLSCAALSTPVMAADLMVASAMQRCSTNEECALVTNSCADNCGFVPINKSNLPALQQMYQARCNKTMESNPTCNMNPPIAAACINSRCTIDYAYANNAGPKDYQAGAYPTSEAPVPDKVPAGDYSHINDRHGFTAYDLPQADVRQKSIGELNTTVYVPPSAPVSGGSYVPVTPGMPAPSTVPVPAAAAPPAPASAVPANIPPVAVPSNMSYATPPVVTPTLAPQAQAPVPAPIPSGNGYVPPPVMTPSVPNQLPPGTPGYTAPAAPAPYEYVAPETKPTIPAPGLPAAAPVPAAPASSTPAIPSVGATGVPQAPANAIPIPPSDMKPAPTFVPPTGSAIPVAPDDPGAPPPPGTAIIMKKGPDGSPGLIIKDPNAKGNTTNFNNGTASKLPYQMNQ